MTSLWNTTILILIGLGLITSPLLSGEDNGFVRVTDGVLTFDGKPWAFVGVNTYWLVTMAARGDTQKVEEIFETASRFGFQCIRTWGFYDGDLAGDPAVIQYAPQLYNEQSLCAMDWVIAKAGKYGIRLIIPFVNSWDDYGGMNQYVRWYAEEKGVDPALSKEKATESVKGPGGRTYRLNSTAGYVHDDFYGIEVIKQWFRSYIEMIITRRNTINGLTYRDDPTILGWELANEPRSSDRTGKLVNSWCAEIASFIKSLDTNHLVATGEEGFDVDPREFSASQVYDNRDWLFDGTAGISFTQNLAISDIDIGTFHLYVDLWGVPLSSAHSWIHDHVTLARQKGKPIYLGEFGVRENKAKIFDQWLQTLLNLGADGALAWDLVDSGSIVHDPYAFSSHIDQDVCEVLGRYSKKFSSGNISPVVSAVPELRQNYPNPSTGITVIEFSIPDQSYLSMSLFDIQGSEVVRLIEGEYPKGAYRIALNSAGYGSGIYFYRLQTGGTTVIRKCIFIH